MKYGVDYFAECCGSMKEMHEEVAEEQRVPKALSVIRYLNDFSVQRQLSFTLKHFRGHTMTYLLTDKMLNLSSYSKESSLVCESFFILSVSYLA